MSLDDQPTDAFPPRQDQKRPSLPNVGLALQISHWHRTREVTGFSRWQTIFVSRGGDSFNWLTISGFADVPRRQLILENGGRPPPRPLLGATHTISLQSLSAQGVWHREWQPGLR
ncbi:hypothetical protein [Mesorhizobium sp. M4B.F.Ca.ET.089.01.1.1]|uniref:hypothetical protein n=1 Tax=Mesorhizobium sp. M4B.F.Ca.ET.089.01.1.1 TaxID=2496662 RepID=UPI0016751906